ncbi:Haloacid dehalogenase-like hydrolase domain-containing 3 [Mycena indigotica]|uniref:Haloacid dehalogenase-like hydrolase domain-containing 3 n=1 Tax=Mycena indigotica TaxID=2126181 RepID=A0A8H6WKC2_9AGAR|nr:Haloacid dehalogenase-like hydrolase domain-containing 3 [Mycena indigotica]KAF7315579.1 Haloacid dehalogenase-like hydrolase domain-containing 3 [Mycena indigotica]
MSASKIKLVSWDLLHTLVLPRYPIAVAYQRSFEPFLGRLDLAALERSFPIALRRLQKDKPLYGGDSRDWWSQVICQTGLGAGADPHTLDASLPSIVDNLMTVFSSKEGYKAREHSIQVLNELNQLGVHTAVVSNADSRMLSVIQDLGFPRTLFPVILSEAVGFEKPSIEIFHHTLERVNAGRDVKIALSECVHIGDEIECDYNGAREAGMNALLLKRVDEAEGSTEGNGETVDDMEQILDWVRKRL